MLFVTVKQRRGVKGIKTLSRGTRKQLPVIVFKTVKMSRKVQFTQTEYTMKTKEQYHPHISIVETIMNLIKLYHRASFNIGCDTFSFILK